MAIDGSMFDQGTSASTPIDTQPRWVSGKAPGGGMSSPAYVDPMTGQYVDPYTGLGTGYTITGDTVQSPTTVKPAYDWTTTPAPNGFHWVDGILVPDDTSGTPTGAAPSGAAPSGGSTPPPGGGNGAGAAGGYPPYLPPPPTNVPVDFAPPSAEGFHPGAPASRPAEGFRGPNLTFAAAIPRAAGNAQPMAPQSAQGYAPDVPAWMRGLMRSPYARYVARGGSSLGPVAGFQPDAAPPGDEEQRRLAAQSANAPAWATPTL